MRGNGQQQVRAWLALLAVLSWAGAAAAQPAVPVVFAPGQTMARLDGSIKGDASRSYLVEARAGQTLTVALQAVAGAAEMNVWAPGNDTAISLGSPDPYRFVAVLAASGRYRVQVYQMRAAARRGALARYALSISLTGG